MIDYMQSLQVGINYFEKLLGMNYNQKNVIPKKNEIVHFTGDLTAAQKADLKPCFKDEHTLSISFQKHPEINLTIRRQDIFTSKAEVIVNAANAHLGGGGGIDGAIHSKGGAEYAKAHQNLQKEYHSNYTEGYAAMIGSGALKAQFNIDNVIVVAGPQGATSSSTLFQKFCAQILI